VTDGAVRRAAALGAACVRADAVLRQWPVASALLLSIAIALAAALGALLLLIVATIVILRPQQMVVSPQERIIIFRNGRFHRIAGPGPVWFLSRMDTDERCYDTSNQPRSVWVYGVRVHGIPAALQINLWMRTDLEEVAEGNWARLVEMALLKERARDAQVAVEIKRAIDAGLATLVAANHPSTNAPLLARLGVVLPGMPLCAELLVYLKRELAPGLRAVGVILDPTKPISLIQTDLPEDVVQVLKRGVLLDSLNEQLPDLPADMRAQVAASIEGLQPLHIQELVVKTQGESPVVRDRVPLKDGSLVDLDLAHPATSNDGQGSRPPATGPQPAAPTQQLSQQDLQVLKRVARDPRVHRKAGALS
jgi:hypothetical protein